MFTFDRRLLSRAPLAALIAIGLCAIASFVGWAWSVASVPASARRLLIVGDSTIGNYRLRIGQRLEDAVAAELGGSWVAHNYAERGTRPGDFYLMLERAEMLGFAPDFVVIAFAPSKLIEITPVSRYGPSNEDLRYLPIDGEGLAIYRTLSPELRRQAIVDEMGLLLFFLDLLEPVWRDHVAWPLKRWEATLDDPAVRNAMIYDDAVREGGIWAENDRAQTVEAFDALEDVQDLDFFVGVLRRRRIPFVLLLMPQAHVGIAPQAFSEAAQATLRRGYDRVLDWSRAHGVPVIDLNAPSERHAFPASAWDDIWHLKSPASFRHVAARVGDWIRAHPSP